MLNFSFSKEIVAEEWQSKQALSYCLTFQTEMTGETYWPDTI